jgi:hypothetical protein
VGLLAPLAGVLLFGLAVGAGGLLAPETALAETALFRVEQRWHNAPFPPVTTPGGAGMDQGYIQPYNYGRTGMGAYATPPGTATVESGNPIGGQFTLPQSFIDVVFTNVITPKTGWPGYTTTTVSHYYNGPGVFKQNNTHTNQNPSRIVFPTTGGNAYPNYGFGNPVTPTTTFDGRYDISRAGSINVTPGSRQFGGSFRAFYRPEAFWYQYIYYFTPAIYKLYAEFSCLDDGVVCTPNNIDSNPGDLTAVYRGTRYLLNVKGSGTGDRLQSNTAKATQATTPYGTKPTVGGAGTPSGGAPASFIHGAQQYLGMIHPWTTGFASVKNWLASSFAITPQAQGYDISLGGADITVTHHDWNQVWNKTLSTIVTTTVTTKQYLYGVGRVVSMVRPRLIHTYTVPIDFVGRIENTWQAARMWRLKVFFLPEPAGMLMLGVGVAGLLGLSRMRRR